MELKQEVIDFIGWFIGILAVLGGVTASGIMLSSGVKAAFAKYPNEK
jgi:hypothetical protein